MRSKDDGVRGKRGICISVRRVGNDVELTCDDVTLKESVPFRATWQQKTFITFAQVSQQEIEEGPSEQRIRDLGHFVWGLLAPLMRDPRSERGVQPPKEQP